MERTTPHSASVSYTAPVGEDNCAGAVTSVSGGTNYPSGTVFGHGNTSVEYEVEDGGGLGGKKNIRKYF